MSALAWALAAAALPPGSAAPAPVQAVEPAPTSQPQDLAPGDVTKLPTAARALDRAPKEALVRARPRHAPGDPFEKVNRRFFAINAGLDRKIFRPAALGYKHAVPRFLRAALRNFFSNLTEPVVFLNDMLQLKPGRAAKTLVRFAVNSTAGFGGLADPAKLKPLRIPHHDNGFGSTLGRYGVGPGPYIYLPFAGPTTLRDLLGGQADRLVLPFTVQQPPFDRYEYQVPKAVITGLDARAESDDELKALFSGAVDPYATLRSVFLQNRAGEIAALRGRPRVDAPVPAGELDDPLRDPAAKGPSEPTPTPAGVKPAAAPSELADPLDDPAAAAPPPALKP